jgi:hypothetical protein
MRTDELVETGDPVDALGQPASPEAPTLCVLNMHVVVGLSPVHSDKDHLTPPINGTSVEPEDPSSFLMVQCSRHDIPPAVEGDLTDRPGHDLDVGLEALAVAVLTRRWLG